MQETKEVATVIGYRGKITEFDASSRFAQIDTKEAMYIEYQRMSDKINAQYSTSKWTR